jgi:hypothetical protein
MQLSGPPHESPQLAVSIRHQADLAPRECGFHRVPLGGKQAQTADDQPQPENSDRSSSNFQSRVACWAYLCGDFPPPPENGSLCQEDPSVFRGPAQSQPVHIAAANVLSLGLSCAPALRRKDTNRAGSVIPYTLRKQPSGIEHNISLCCVSLSSLQTRC